MNKMSELTGCPVAGPIEHYVVRSLILHAKQFDSYKIIKILIIIMG